MTPWKHILAVDTSSLTQSVAVLGPQGLLAQRDSRPGAGHASLLLASIHDALREAHLTLHDLDLLVVGAGPGSFTGLRVGLAALKTLAWARHKPLVTASSLEALAADLHEPGLTVPLFDARKGQLYAALYQRHDDPDAPLTPLLHDAAFDPPDLLRALAQHAHGQPLRLLGEGVKKYGASLQRDLLALGVHASLHGERAVPALHLATIARRDTSPDRLPNLHTLEPNYQRLSEAEDRFGPSNASSILR
jgi:tRNA threonylcarbamoyladenosine biosynthesis protein TsaB